MKPASASKAPASGPNGARIKRDRRFAWAYLFGAICPARGTGAALVMPTVSIEAMSCSS
jgi:hypothetical protein